VRRIVRPLDHPHRIGARIERDNREPHFRTIRKLAKALGVEPAEPLPKE
jgi:transcriptional regulator with XRE-family HTH domain